MNVLGGSNRTWKLSAQLVQCCESVLELWVDSVLFAIFWSFGTQILKFSVWFTPVILDPGLNHKGVPYTERTIHWIIYRIIHWIYNDCCQRMWWMYSSLMAELIASSLLLINKESDVTLQEENILLYEFFSRSPTRWFHGIGFVLALSSPLLALWLQGSIFWVLGH